MNNVWFDNSKSFSLLNYIDEFVRITGEDFVVKGGFALYKMYGGSSPSSRLTVDLDLHVKVSDSWNKFKSIEVWKSSKMGVEFCLDLDNSRSKVTPNGERVMIKIISNGFEIGEFRVDMNYGDYCKYVSFDGINIYDYSMIVADKLSVVCSSKIRRRCKDLYDLFLISSHIKCNMGDLAKEIVKKVGDSYHFGMVSLFSSEYIEAIVRAYNGLDISSKPSFTILSDRVLSFILPLLGCLDNKDFNSKLVWNGFEWGGGRLINSRVLSDITGTVYGSSASGLLKMSTFPIFPMTIARDSNPIDLGLFKFVVEECGNTLGIAGSNTLRVTDKFFTIIDCIMHSEYRIASECVEYHLDEGGNLELLYNALDKEYHYLLDDIVDGLREDGLI